MGHNFVTGRLRRKTLAEDAKRRNQNTPRQTNGSLWHTHTPSQHMSQSMYTCNVHKHTHTSSSSAVTCSNRNLIYIYIYIYISLCIASILAIIIFIVIVIVSSTLLNKLPQRTYDPLTTTCPAHICPPPRSQTRANSCCACGLVNFAPFAFFLRTIFTTMHAHTRT